MSERSRKKLDKNIKIKQISSGSLTSSGVVSSRNEIYEKIIERTGKVTELIPLDLLEPANPDWYFFPPLSEDKIAEMITSILNFGLIHSIIVWKQKSGKYMILSGHNRVRAYEKILNNYNTNEEFRAFIDETYEDFNVDNYKEIQAIVYEVDELNEYEAQNILLPKIKSLRKH